MLMRIKKNSISVATVNYGTSFFFMCSLFEVFDRQYFVEIKRIQFHNQNFQIFHDKYRCSLIWVYSLSKPLCLTNLRSLQYNVREESIMSGKKWFTFRHSEIDLTAVKSLIFVRSSLIRVYTVRLHLLDLVLYAKTPNLSQLIRLWYISHRRSAKAQASLRIRTVSPEPLLFAHMKYGSR